MTKLHGRITFSMPTSNRSEERMVRIEIIDELSGTRFLDLEMSPATFSLATVGSLGFADCEFELYPEKVGKTREHKTELVPLNREYTEDEKAVALAKFEIDGWQAYQKDIGNHHKRSKDGKGWHVNFTRWVDGGNTK